MGQQTLYMKARAEDSTTYSARRRWKDNIKTDFRERAYGLDLTGPG